jgi:hypothetical protein
MSHTRNVRDDSTPERRVTRCRGRTTTLSPPFRQSPLSSTLASPERGEHMPLSHRRTRQHLYLVPHLFENVAKQSRDAHCATSYTSRPRTTVSIDVVLRSRGYREAMGKGQRETPRLNHTRQYRTQNRIKRVRCTPVPGAGAVSAGTGAVSTGPTRTVPVRNLNITHAPN